MILLDPDYNPSIDKQAIARVTHIGRRRAFCVPLFRQQDVRGEGRGQAVSQTGRLGDVLGSLETDVKASNYTDEREHEKYEGLRHTKHVGGRRRSTRQGLWKVDGGKDEGPNLHRPERGLHYDEEAEAYSQNLIAKATRQDAKDARGKIINNDVTFSRTEAYRTDDALSHLLGRQRKAACEDRQV